MLRHGRLRQVALADDLLGEMGLVAFELPDDTDPCWVAQCFGDLRDPVTVEGSEVGQPFFSAEWWRLFDRHGPSVVGTDRRLTAGNRLAGPMCL